MKRTAAALALFAALGSTTAARGGATDLDLQHALDRIRAAPHDASGFGELAGWLFRRGELGRARAAAAEAARLEPESPALQRLLGYVATSAGASAEAEGAFRRAVELDPASRTSLADFHLARAWAGYQDALRRGGPDRGVLERLREIAAATDLNPEVKSMLHGGWGEEPASGGEAGPPIHLGAGIGTALVVEKRTQTVRLYGRSPNGVGLLKTYPCTTGQAEGAKRERGDLKTPDGVYFFSDIFPGERLPKQYGVVALPLSYPNAWDRHAGRSGHGIWFHGTDRLGSPFTPRDTQGCVIMRNEDLLELATLVEPQTTPILIAEEVPDRPAAEWQSVLRGLEKRGAGPPPDAIIAAPEYTLLLRRSACRAESAAEDRALSPDVPCAPESVSYDFVPTRDELRFALQETATSLPRTEWEEKLRMVRPESVSLERVAVGADGQVVIETSAPARPFVFRPEFAERVYLDLRGVVSGPVPQTYAGAGIVQRVRVSTVAFEPPLTRIVIDLSRGAAHRIEQEGARIIVSLAPSTSIP